MKKTLICLSMLLAVSVASAECYSEGIRIGELQKFSQKGMVNKSWEGELVMEGIKLKANTNGLKGGNVWAFSVLDPQVAKSIDEVAMTGGMVALKYCQSMIKGFTTDTPYLIVKAVPRAK
jgi:hypothetical protein